MTPSSAATTITAMSVTLAPRARIDVNASWPGVSRKTTRLPSLVVTSDAPMCWVMPPRSPAATVVERIASSRLVLPWSTWPMTVTIGARSTRLASSSASSSQSCSFAASAGAPLPSSSSSPRGDGGLLGDLVAQLLGDQRRGVAVDELVDGREDAALDQLADDVGRAGAEEVGELLDGDRARQLDRAALGRVDDLDRAGRERAGATRGLPRAASAAGAAPTSSHWALLRGDRCSGRRGRRAGWVRWWVPRPRGRRRGPRGAPRGTGALNAWSRARFRAASSQHAASRQR